jgi:stage II sporulation protein D
MVILTRIVCLSFLMHSFAFAYAPAINVKIAANLPNITLEGNNLNRRLLDQPSAAHRSFQGQQKVMFDCNAKNPQVINKQLLASISSPAGLIKWNNNTYKGELLLHKNPGEQKCDLIHKVSLENYISTLLTKEVNKNWPIEVLKAQAVAARTYALYHVQQNVDAPFDLENSEKFQVNGTFDDENYKTISAANQTKGEVLFNLSHQIEPIFYHSKCGGRTLQPHMVWGGMMPSYQAVDCPFCKKHGRGEWNKVITTNEFKISMNKVFSKYFKKQELLNQKEIVIAPDQPFNRELRVYIGGKLEIIPKPMFRNVMGRDFLPSNNFTIKMNTGRIAIQGEGYGHGVGMCQFGALELARRGYDYKQILGYYFPQHKIEKINL